MVPDEDDPEPETTPGTGAETASGPKPVQDPEPSYNPEEIEGGDNTEDDTRDA
jgi:hypothetical protein